MKKMILVGLVASVSVLSGCASIVNDKNQTVTVVASNGKELKGTIQNVTTKVTHEDGKNKKTHETTIVSNFDSANSVVIARSNTDKVVVVDEPTCQKETPIKKSVSPWFFGNAILGGLLGSTTDAASEKMWQYEEKVIVPCSK